MSRGPSPLWLAVGAAVGTIGAMAAPQFAEVMGTVVFPAHAMVILALASSLPLLSVGRAYQEPKVWGALLVINLVAVPVIAFVMSRVVWSLPELQVGILLVLLSPGIALSLPMIRGAGGDAESVLSATPVVLAAQLALVPLFAIWLSGGVLSFADLPSTFWVIGSVIIAPVAVAGILQAFAAKGRAGAQRLSLRLSRGVVGWASLAIALTVWNRLPAGLDRLGELNWIVPFSIAFLVLIAPVSLLIGSLAGVPPAKRRAIMIAGAGRGGIVVLPITLGLDPAVWGLVPLVVVAQVVIEAAGLLVYRTIVPEIIDTPGR